ncbi:MAG: GGDEF domain-containing protein, partial [Clostridiales bacterium]|nr:GGDEF domain-containing protein [Clostridiales bacterium]
TQIFSAEDFADFMGKLRATTPDNSVITAKYLLTLHRDKTWCKVIAKALWSEGETPELEGAIGKIVDVNAETAAMTALEQKADHDSRTGLLNHNAAKKRIGDILANAGGRKYALAVFDLDNFKQANDVYGHLFGDEVLEEVALRMKNNIRSTDIAARMGGDEFILFMEYKDNVEPQIQRIFKHLTVPHKQFAVGVSMGIATTENFTGTYEELFARADAAMYDIKRDSKNQYKFYCDGMPASTRA